ncbi:helix-turn-helix domain-containing protein [Neobacillus sp. PS3-40]|uniref:helix-turn-helix domain-containing protein n=1 Tax=Neobacillus sp. PS3-40 TaxID=3070679 RepID=UPI0027DF1973|nr:helix-turn-helix domain-containing protein [Neobacillus sp. PS3-40]WML45395.1 helix-turn-helix domain-containing protein [Neobacillus sp. PS3-40]
MEFTNVDKIPDNIMLNPETIGKLICVAPKTVRRWVNENKLPSCNPGGHHRILGKDLKKFLEQKPKKGHRINGRVIENLQGENFDSWMEKVKKTGEKSSLPLIFEVILDYKVYKSGHVAKMLGVTPATVRLLVSQKGLRSVNTKGHHVILGKDLKEFLFKRIT